MTMDRIGIDVGRKLPLEDAVAWARRHGVAHIDIQLDTGANAFTRIDAERGRRCVGRRKRRACGSRCIPPLR